MKKTFRRNLREASHRYDEEEMVRIDTLAEIDQQAFWKVVNSKSTNSKQNGRELDFDGKRETTIDGVLRGWNSHFKRLYSFEENPKFDPYHKELVENSVTEYLKTPDDLDYTEFVYETHTTELDQIIKELPNNKSASLDNITYEHLKYGGPTLTECLAKFFNTILAKGQIPGGFKHGLIVTLHKGKGKQPTDPNSYRAISLIPVVAKLFEKIIMKRIENISAWSRLNKLQYGFQKNKNCKMVSYMLQEARDYCCERGSSLHACYLDAQSAFDKVWINGLIYKLHHIGVRGKLLRIIFESLQNCTSRVLSRGFVSEPFAIEQGTRQGSICAPFFYIVFINELLNELATSPYGLQIGDLSLCSPTQADDVALLSLSRRGLNELVQKCNVYANRWRFTYNASKCAVMTMGRKRTKAEPPLQITYDSISIPEAAKYKHLGIIQSISGKYPYDIDTVKQTIRGTFLSLSQKVSERSGTNPNTAIKLYNTAVIPKALFGCELWNSISNADMQQLEVAHHFCLKRAQGLPHLTRSDMVLGLAGMTSIEAQIDLHKLAFLGSLCRAPTDEPCHKLFILRLCQFDLCENRKIGFIPDIANILQKYQLEDYLTML